MELGGGLKLLLLSPDDEGLAKMYPVWEAALEEAGLRPSDPDSDADEGDGAFEVSGPPPM